MNNIHAVSGIAELQLGMRAFIILVTSACGLGMSIQ